jgi:hypothetical protein
VKDVAGHLLHRYGGAQVSLQMTEHYLPDPEELIRAEQGGAEQGRDLVTPLGTYALARVQSPPGASPMETLER